MLEQALAVAAEKVDLMPAAFLTHRFQAFDRMRFGHFRGEFAKQVRFGHNTVKDFLADEQHLFKHCFLRAKHEIHDALVRLVPSRRSFRDRIFNDRRTRFVKFQHDGVRFCTMFE
jgi:hypothetical protein